MGKFVSEDSENSKNVSSINEILYKNANSNSKKESYVDKEKRGKRGRKRRC